jgi:DNA uptake protein ComE-like DNA-binding protein
MIRRISIAPHLRLRLVFVQNRYFQCAKGYIQLNAHSSRSHAILCVKLTQITGENVLISTASAIDLAGSEDNRRTDNNKDRLVESSAINKSLFVLAQCVEAISKKQARIPYRESKMTRILALGQNNGMTVMILNLAPVRSYHLDTLSSLNFANRTKKIEINEIENEPMFKGVVIPKTAHSLAGPTLNRQPLRPLVATTNIQRQQQDDPQKKPVKSFSVYSDKSKIQVRQSGDSVARSTTQKRIQDSSFTSSSRPAKTFRAYENLRNGLSKAEIEAMIDRKVNEKIAEKALNEKVKPVDALPGDLQTRLDALEQRVAEKEDSEGLQFLLMAKQHHARGEDASALRMYKLAQPFFPHNEKLEKKIQSLQNKVQRKQEPSSYESAQQPQRQLYDRDDGDYRDAYELADEGEDSFVYKPKKKAAHKVKVAVFKDESQARSAGPPSPRTQQLIDIINTRDIMQIRALKGVGNKKAEAIVSSLCDMDDGDNALITDLVQLGGLKGVGAKTVENMRMGLAFAA